MSDLNDSTLVARARSGDREALGALLDSLRGPLHRVAVSMFWNREDAEDATQEALIAVMTNLASFREESSLSTWAHRIAVRLYLRRRRSPTERLGLTFDAFAGDLLDGLTAPDSERPDADLLAEEVRVGCTLAVLQCLHRDDRLVFIFGDVVGLTGAQAAEVLGISHAAYRQRLARVRAQVRDAVARQCGLVNRAAACRCERRVDVAIRTGRVNPDRLRFVDRSTLEDTKQQIQDLHDATALFRSVGAFDTSTGIAATVADLLARTAGPLLENDLNEIDQSRR